MTTPESLFLILSSGARETLRDVEAVIVDEVHALAGVKRGVRVRGWRIPPSLVGTEAAPSPRMPSEAWPSGHTPVAGINNARLNPEGRG